MKKIIDSKWLNYVLIATPYLMMSISYFSSNDYVSYILFLILLCAVPVVIYKNWGNKEYFNRLALFSCISVIVYFYITRK